MYIFPSSAQMQARMIMKARYAQLKLLAAAVALVQVFFTIPHSKTSISLQITSSLSHCRRRHHHHFHTTTSSALQKKYFLHNAPLKDT